MILSGKKSYIMGAAMVIFGAISLAMGKDNNGLEFISGGLALIFLREGVKKSRER